MQVDLVIFDCDGVLIDSEMLSAGVLMGMMEEIGLPITEAIFRSDFLGRSFAAAASKTEERFGRAMPKDFQLRYRSRLLAKMRASLQPMKGVFEVLQAMKRPFCLATSSSPQRLDVSLDVTALGPWFAGKAFTASEVPNGKPAPDLFLHAARQMGIDPALCLVIEDSEMGVLAAKAADMAVWQFTGGSHCRSGMPFSDGVKADRVVPDMLHLLADFQRFGIC